MAKAATHFGTCQVCGSRQKLPSGVLAKHGYTLKFGFFSGTCWGSDALPFEQSKDLIEGAIARATKRAAELDLEAAEFERPATAPKARAHVYKDRAQCEPYEKPGYAWVDGTIEARRMHGGYRFAIITAKGHAFGVSDGYNYDATEVDVATHNNREWAQQLRKWAQDAREYAEWQKGRIANWQPKELDPVKPEHASGPVVHMSGSHYYKGRAHLCAASYSGAGTYVSKIITDDRSKVTCKGCLKALAARDERQRAREESK
jgi:hypothetical protein